MAEYFSGNIPTDDIVLLADVSEGGIDRQVVVSSRNGSPTSPAALSVGFSATTVWVPIPNSGLSFVLPAGIQLWGGGSQGNGGFIITKVDAPVVNFGPCS